MVGIGFRVTAFAILLVAVALQPARSQDIAQRNAAQAGGSQAAPSETLAQDARAQGRSRDSGGHQPGQFDFYVLALSWSPSFCQDSEERGRNGGEQCSTARPYSFVVHGLWPQYERGFPQNCEQ